MASPRTVKRRLLHNKFSYLFGRRVKLTLRVPQNIFPESPPVFDVSNYSLVPIDGNLWDLDLKDKQGTFRLYDIGHISGQWANDPGCWRYFEGSHDPGEPYYEQYDKWYSGFIYTVHIDASGESTSEPDVDYLSEEALKAYHDEQVWINTYIMGSTPHGESPMEWMNTLELPEWLEQHLEVSRYCKTMWVDFVGDEVWITYIVKPMYPNLVNGFASAMGKLLKMLHHQGIPAQAR